MLLGPFLTSHRLLLLNLKSSSRIFILILDHMFIKFPSKKCDKKYLEEILGVNTDLRSLNGVTRKEKS